MTKFLTDSTKKLIKDGLIIGATSFICVALWKYNTKMENKLRERSAAEAEAKMNAICPSLFSVTRSARDTLIVMKAEDVCADFILNNLK